MRAGLTLLLVAVAFFTQRYYAWDEAVLLGASDALSYEAIALAAPDAPAEKLRFHRAQRWVAAYAVGMLARALRVDVRHVFSVASAVCLLAAIALIHLCLLRLKIPPDIFATCMALFVFHYSLKFYLIAPGMLPDALFIFSLALTLYGLLAGRLAMVLGGVLLAALARQSALLLIPGIAFYLVLGETWVTKSHIAKAASVLAVILLCVLIYLFTGATGASFAEPTENIEAITGLFSWLAGPDFTMLDLLLFVGYAVFPLLIPGAMLLAALWPLRSSMPKLLLQAELGGNLLLAGALLAQPLLGGPDWVGNGNAMRLSALGLAPLVIALACVLKKSAMAVAARSWLAWSPILLALASLHYNYTVIGPRTIAEFAVTHVIVAVVLAALVLAWSMKGSTGQK